jgi:hypothetical protein
VEKIAIRRLRLFCTRRYWDCVCFRECNHLRAPWELIAKTLFPPRRDHLQIRRKRCGRKFKPHLVVPLSGRAMRDGIGFLGLCNFNHPLRNQWPRDARAEKILVLVNGSGLKHRKNEIAREFSPQVLYDTFGCAGAERFLFDTFKLLFLTDIGTEGDDISLIIFLQLTQNDRGIKPAGVC